MPCGFSPNDSFRVGNPHGEESELLYFVEEDVIRDFDVEVRLNPDLEILW